MQRRLKGHAQKNDIGQIAYRQEGSETLPSCPECGASIDEKDKFCRNCGKQFQPTKESRPASATELAKIAGMQDKIKEYRSASNWVGGLGAVLSIVISISLAISDETSQTYQHYAFIFVSIYIPFAIVAIILAYYKGKLQRKLEKGELT